MNLRTDLAASCTTSQRGDVDGIGSQVRLDDPLVIVQDILNPRRLLFTDAQNSKIKSLNLTNNAVRTEYVGTNQFYALAQNPLTGDVYFTSQRLNSPNINIYRLPGENLNSSAELVGTLEDMEVVITTYEFTNMIFIHNASKLMVLQPMDRQSAAVKLFNINTSPPQEIACDLGIEGLQYNSQDGATGLYLGVDDTLYIGGQLGIAKIAEFSRVVEMFCPTAP